MSKGPNYHWIYSLNVKGLIELMRMFIWDVDASPDIFFFDRLIMIKWSESNFSQVLNDKNHLIETKSTRHLFIRRREFYRYFDSCDCN